VEDSEGGYSIEQVGREDVEVSSLVRRGRIIPIGTDPHEGRVCETGEAVRQ
jgi:hypothetical protein